MPKSNTTSSDTTLEKASAETDRKAYMKAFRARQKASGSVRVTVNLTPEEVIPLRTSAKFHRHALATHIKTQALAAVDRKFLVPPDMTERLDSFVAVMRGIGNNLNQLARYSNEMKAFLETGEVREQVKRMEAVICEFVTNPKPHPQTA